MSEDFYKALGEKIHDWRVRRGLPQEEVGRRLSPPVTGQTVSSIEGGQQRVFSDTLVQLALLLGVPVSELLPDGDGRFLADEEWESRSETKRLEEAPQGEEGALSGSGRAKEMEAELVRKLRISKKKAKALMDKLSGK